MPLTSMHRYKITAALSAGLLAAACASISSHDVQVAIDSAEVSLRQAQDMRAAEFAAYELSNAQQNLQVSKEAAQSDDRFRARKFALAAKVDADLAAAKTTKAQASGAPGSQNAPATLQLDPSMSSPATTSPSSTYGDRQ